ncbi:restriction endonuclease subunit S [Treponema primitia]|uniref:restriction endonuclease subunit S n=1 Tax=Treponema primitia TaxID=88058 RepID=UPI00191C5029|nr:restriction endonuclease subunit S [Treponema primitia]
MTNPMGWEHGTIRDIVTEVKYGTSKPSVDGGSYPYLRMNNITFGGQLDITDMKYIDLPNNEIEKYIVRKGDVLFNRTNSKELVGKTCVFNLDEPMVIAGYIIRIRLNDKAIPIYLSTVLNSDYGKLTLNLMCKKIIGMANINAQELQDIAILIPPKDLQNAFAAFVHQVDKSKFSDRKWVETFAPSHTLLSDLIGKHQKIHLPE